MFVMRFGLSFNKICSANQKANVSIAGDSLISGGSAPTKDKSAKVAKDAGCIIS